MGRAEEAAQVLGRLEALWSETKYPELNVLPTRCAVAAALGDDATAEASVVAFNAY
jgi:hypothetical protein